MPTLEHFYNERNLDPQRGFVNLECPETEVKIDITYYLILEILSCHTLYLLQARPVGTFKNLWGAST